MSIQKCKAFVDSIAHPNERVLAESILSGIADEQIIHESGFDQAQIDNMKQRIDVSGCLNEEQKPEPVEEAPAPEAEGVPETSDEPSDDNGEGGTELSESDDDEVSEEQPAEDLEEDKAE